MNFESPVLAAPKLGALEFRYAFAVNLMSPHRSSLSVIRKFCLFASDKASDQPELELWKLTAQPLERGYCGALTSLVRKGDWPDALAILVCGANVKAVNHSHSLLGRGMIASLIHTKIIGRVAIDKWNIIATYQISVIEDKCPRLTLRPPFASPTT